MKKLMPVLTFAMCLGLGFPAGADEDNAYFDMDLEDILGLDLEAQEVRGLTFYGYMRANVERVYDVPSVGEDGSTVTNTDPMEWSNPNFNLYGQSRLTSNIDVLFNVFGEDTDFEIKNAWGNLKLYDELQVRVGKQYRRFGLFNEKLDQAPVFVGIEPPELLDGDHLIVPRTTQFAVHGQTEVGTGDLYYTLDTDNSESGAAEDVIPLGYDVRYKTNNFVVGVSGYESSIAGGKTSSTVSVGSGSPSGGVLPWMSGDKYRVYGACVEATWHRALIQTAYWIGDHEATRNAADVLTLVSSAGINQAQKDRFLGENSSQSRETLTEDDVVTTTNYKVKTSYIRLGYTIPTEAGTVTPYVHWDWMDNPETIQSKTYGGDNEAGFADDGQFTKYSTGVVYRPVDSVAIKFDSSVHSQKFNGKTETYPEVRADFSFAFKM